MFNWPPKEYEIGAELPPEQPAPDMFSGLDPRVAEHMRKKQEAEQGVKTANTMAGVAQFGDMITNAGRKPIVMENRMQDLGRTPGMIEQEQQKTNTSGLQDQAREKLKAASHDAGDAVKVAFEQRKAQLAAQVAKDQAAKENDWKQKDFDYKVKNDEANRKLELQKLLASRANAAGVRAQGQEDKLAAKLEDRQYKESQQKLAADGKRKDQVVEVEDRRTNIKQNIALLKKMIKDNGTYEMFGSHNQDMDRMVEQIATDMAKLSDPTSVARPSEVDAVKANLVKSGFQNKNSTALDLLNNFEKEVDTRADTAYKIRGLTPPASAPEVNGSATPPPAGQEMDGFIFLGGDPSNQANWKQK